MRRFNKTLLLFVGVTVAGMLLSLLAPDSTAWRIWSNLDVSFAVALGILAFVAYKDMLRDEDEVRIYFDVEGRKIDTGLCLLRKDCSRSEVIGVIAMMQRRTDSRFHYDSSHLHDLLQEINRVQKGQENKLFVPLRAEEFRQFALCEEEA